VSIITGIKPMQLTIDIGYDQVFQLVRQLSSREQKRLAKEIVSPEQEPKCSRKKWKQILSNTPILKPGDAQNLEETLNNFRKDFNDAFERRRLGLVGSD
jgi:hypothetical protein